MRMVLSVVVKCLAAMAVAVVVQSYATPVTPPLSVVLSVVDEAVKAVLAVAAMVATVKAVTPKIITETSYATPVTMITETSYATPVTMIMITVTSKVKVKPKVRDSGKALVAQATHVVLQVQ